MMLVLPPRVQGVWWWAWHSQAGTSHVRVLAVLLRHRQCQALGFGVEAVESSDVEGAGVAVEDHRDDPGLAREPAGGARTEVAAGVDGRGLQPTEDGVEFHGDHDGGVDAAGVGSLSAG